MKTLTDGCNLQAEGEQDEEEGGRVEEPAKVLQDVVAQEVTSTQT